MKKRVGGRVYDTATAERVHSWENGRTGSLYRFRDLYRTRNGMWFLHLSRELVSQSPWGTWESLDAAARQQGDQRIVPLTPEGAASYLAYAGARDAFEK